MSESPIEEPPPAGGFGAAAAPAGLRHRVVAPPRAPTAHHALFIGIGLIMGFFVLCGGLAMWRKQRDAREAEALNAIGQIAKDITSSYESTGKLCPSARPIPADIERVRAKQYASSLAEWETDPGWTCMGFSMLLPQRYQYRVDTHDEYVTITAAGDLDGDDVRATYTMEGHVDEKLRRIVWEGTIRRSNPGE